MTEKKENEGEKSRKGRGKGGKRKKAIEATSLEKSQNCPMVMCPHLDSKNKQEILNFDCKSQSWTFGN